MFVSVCLYVSVSTYVNFLHTQIKHAHIYILYFLFKINFPRNKDHIQFKNKDYHESVSHYIL